MSETATAAKNSNSNTRKRVLPVIAVIFAVIAGYFLYQQIMYVSTDDAQIDGHSVMLAAKVGGYVTAVHVEEGQRVKKGDILVEIDERDYKNTLEQMQGELTNVQVAMRDAERNFHRLSELFSSGAISRQQFDGSSAAYYGTKAKFDSITAQVAQAELNLANTKIKAPEDGQIAKKSVEVGQLAAPGVPLIGFVDSTERWVTANFKETDLEAIREGAKASLDVDAISSRTYEGKVASLSAATGATFTLLPPDNATGNFTKVVQRVPVRINLADLSRDEIEKLRVGLSVVVKIHKH
jgi:membrane fusion protein (multidrug efflux system)